MTEKVIPSEHSIVRYISPIKIRKDGSAFCLSQDAKPDDGLSVNWLDFFQMIKADQLAEVRRLVGQRLELKTKGRFAELIVSEVINYAISTLPELKVIHSPLAANKQFEADPSHAEIIGLPSTENELMIMAGDILAEYVGDMHPAIIDN